MKSLKLAIIGSGPAGLTAAIYASRAELNPVVIEGIQPGGQLTTTTEVDNFPGFPEGIGGPELMENMKKQAARFDTEFITQNVKSVDLSKRPFKITLESGEEYEASSIIISTGASAKYLGLPNEQSLIGRGVSACATCDGFFYRNKIIHVIGGGDTAIEEADFLTKFASKVYIVHRRDELRASKAMQQKAFKNPKIEVLWNKTVEAILEDGTGVTGVVLKDTQSGKSEERETDGFFLGIGHTPNTSFLAGQLELDEHGLIKTGEGGSTSVPGVFACGDVQDPLYRQAITAAGTGCMSALTAQKFLAEN